MSCYFLYFLAYMCQNTFSLFTRTISKNEIIIYLGINQDMMESSFYYFEILEYASIDQNEKLTKRLINIQNFTSYNDFDLENINQEYLKYVSDEISCENNKRKFFDCFGILRTSICLKENSFYKIVLNNSTTLERSRISSEIFNLKYENKFYSIKYSLNLNFFNNIEILEENTEYHKSHDDCRQRTSDYKNQHVDKDCKASEDLGNSLCYANRACSVSDYYRVENCKEKGPVVNNSKESSKNVEKFYYAPFHTVPRDYKETFDVFTIENPKQYVEMQSQYVQMYNNNEKKSNLYENINDRTDNEEKNSKSVFATIQQPKYHK
ncbi:uncharacterized protein VNE69_09141 [Vairimorpha necatrix]|uniref:Uncharacterized protein n=1 Tax=Vairimorpha necatrix TaxID=6039 RepID=A0AAX4JFK4_9MICR